MAVSALCPCGKEIRVKDEHAGKRVKCSACGTIVRMPAVPEPDEPEDWDPPSPEIPGWTRTLFRLDFLWVWAVVAFNGYVVNTYHPDEASRARLHAQTEMMITHVFWALLCTFADALLLYNKRFGVWV